MTFDATGLITSFFQDADYSYPMSPKTDRVDLMDKYNKGFRAWNDGDETTWKAGVAENVTFKFPLFGFDVTGKNDVWTNIRQNSVAVNFSPANRNAPLPYHLTFDTFTFDFSDPNAKKVMSSMKAVCNNQLASPASGFVLPANGELVQMSRWTVTFDATGLITSFFQDADFSWPLDPQSRG